MPEASPRPSIPPTDYLALYRQRRSLKDVIEATCYQPRWAAYFSGATQPYRHLEPVAFAALAEQQGFTAETQSGGEFIWNRTFAPASYRHQTTTPQSKCPDAEGERSESILDRADKFP